MRSLAGGASPAAGRVRPDLRSYFARDSVVIPLRDRVPRFDGQFATRESPGTRAIGPEKECWRLSGMVRGLGHFRRILVAEGIGPSSGVFSQGLNSVSES